MSNGEHLQPQPHQGPIMGLVPGISSKVSSEQFVKNGKIVIPLNEAAPLAKLDNQTGVTGPKKIAKAPAKQVKKEKPLKQTQIRIKKGPSKPDSQREKGDADSSSSSGTEDSDSELEVEMDEPSPIPAARPQDAEGGIRYDTLKAVWWPRNKQPPGTAIKNAMILFSDTIKSVRDTWKTRSEALKVAENQNQEDKIPTIKKDVIFQRGLLDLIINTTLEYGHPAFVARYVLFHLL